MENVSISVMGSLIGFSLESGLLLERASWSKQYGTVSRDWSTYWKEPGYRVTIVKDLMIGVLIGKRLRIGILLERMGKGILESCRKESREWISIGKSMEI